ncbi:MAG: hypothetical protein HY552_02430 [Elusimicrobia bacterium]|nr:hypothetical protein [Elusimicrobiota bacterium]
MRNTRAVAVAVAFVLTLGAGRLFASLVEGRVTEGQPGGPGAIPGLPAPQNDPTEQPDLTDQRTLQVDTLRSIPSLVVPGDSTRRAQDSPAGAAGLKERPAAGGAAARPPRAARFEKTVTRSAQEQRKLGGIPGRKPALAPKAPAEAVAESAGIDLSAAQAASQGPQSRTATGLARLYDADEVRGAFGALGVLGGEQSVGDRIAQLTSIANSNRVPAERAPKLYQAAIKLAEDSLPAPVAAQYVAVVRRYAELKAAAALPAFVERTYQAAASAGSDPHAGRRVEGQWKAADQWGALLGHPWIANRSILEADVRRVLSVASAPGAAAPSVPHVHVNPRPNVDGSWSLEGFAGGGVERVQPGAVASLGSVPELASAPDASAAAAREKFTPAPNAENLARAAFRDPAAVALYAARAAREALRRPVSYPLDQDGGRRALEKDARFGTLAALAASEAGAGFAAARRVGGVRKSFDALARAAEAVQGLTGQDDAGRRVASLRAAFEARVKAEVLGSEDGLAPGMASALLEEGQAAYWAGRLRGEAERELYERVRRSQTGPGLIVIGDADGAGAAAARRMIAGGAKALAAVASGGRLWAFASGVDLAANFAPTRDGGFLELSFARGGEELARRLDALGLPATRAGEGVRASLGGQDLPRGAEELADLAAGALAAASSAGVGPEAGLAARQAGDLIAELRRHPEGSPLARDFDGHPAALLAPPVASVGGYELVRFRAARVARRPPADWAALRDPDTGLLAAVVAR